MTDAPSPKLTITITVEIPDELIAQRANELTTLLSEFASFVQSPPLNAPVDDPASNRPSHTPKEIERKHEIRAHFAAKQKQFARDCIQAFRLFRRLKDIYETPHECHQVIACRFDWPVTVVPDFVRLRRRKVEAYLKTRRGKTVLRLRSEGFTLKQIGKQLGLNPQTIGRIAREAAAANEFPQVDENLAREGAVK